MEALPNSDLRNAIFGVFAKLNFKARPDTGFFAHGNLLCFRGEAGAQGAVAYTIGNNTNGLFSFGTAEELEQLIRNVKDENGVYGYLPNAPDALRQTYFIYTEDGLSDEEHQLVFNPA